MGTHTFWLVKTMLQDFQVPIHNSLTQPILIGGAPREFAILNATLGSALLFGLHSILGVPLVIITHTVAVMLTKKDPMFLETFRRED